MKNHHKTQIPRSCSMILVLLFGLGFGMFYFPRSEAKITESKAEVITENQQKYSSFPHSKHKQDCDSCHKFPSSNWKKVRKEAFPDITDYPRHESCLSCHRQQFFGSGSKPMICSICHTRPSPNNSSRHPFANPREIFDLSPKGKTAVSDFGVSFPHDKHIEIVSRNVNPFEPNRNSAVLFIKANYKRAGEESCRVCHQIYQPQDKSNDEYLTKPPDKLGDAFWLKKGTFMTSPIGHTNCFTCHSTDTGILPAPNNCAACHRLKPTEPRSDFEAKVAAPMKISDKITLTSWRKRDSSGTFRHEFDSHKDLDCATCHTVEKMNTLDFKTKKVNVLSCAPCHITATADDGGVLNYEVDERKKDAKFQCVKCHLSFGKMPIPESHTKAIAAQ
jgi:hypothetical protein